jgi:hypothetical protein
LGLDPVLTFTKSKNSEAKKFCTTHAWIRGSNGRKWLLRTIWRISLKQRVNGKHGQTERIEKDRQ